MVQDTFNIVIVGGGLIGISSAYWTSRLAREAGLAIHILLLEKEEPMKLTSCNSTGGFRNFYPQFKSMTDLSNKSIDLMRQLRQEGIDFEMTEAGYLFLSKDPKSASKYIKLAMDASNNGSGQVRINGIAYDNMGEILEGDSFKFDPISSEFLDSYFNHTDGIDIISDFQLMQSISKTTLNPETAIAMHVRKAGYINVELLGHKLLEECISNGVTLKIASFENIVWKNEEKTEIKGVLVKDSNGLQEILAENVLFCPGPFLPEIGAKIQVFFPVVNELHMRVTIEDPHSIFPHSAPFTIWSDSIDLDFTESQVQEIKQLGFNRLLEHFPVNGAAGVHLRPLSDKEGNGKRKFFGIWTYSNQEVFNNPIYPTPSDPIYAPLVLRGACHMIPALSQYVDSHIIPKNITVESGYYCKTIDNTPLIGPLSRNSELLNGLFVCAGVSGYGIMSSQAVSHGISCLIINKLLKNKYFGIPEYLSEFGTNRFDYLAKDRGSKAVDMRRVILMESLSAANQL